MSRTRLAAGAAVLAAILALAALVLRPFGGGGDVPTLVVARGPFGREVVAEGNLDAAEATPVTAPLDAQEALKVAWLVPDGTRVKSGDVVVRFDPADMERALRDGEADRTSADSRITGLKADSGGVIRNLERDAAMAREELEAADRYKIEDPDVFSRQEIIRGEIDRNLATRRIESSDKVRTIRQGAVKVDLALLDIERRKAGITIERATKGLEALEIRAPHDGILIYQRDWRGDITKVGDTVWPGEPLALIPDLATMEAKVFVLEADAGGLAKGLEASVVVEAHPGRAYPATIKKVDTLAKRRTGWIPVQYFGTTLSLATDPDVMKPGQRVRATLRLDAKPDALSVPRNAVFEKDGKKIVYKRSGGTFAPVEVTLGPAAVGRVVVESGLEAGDEIALRDPTANPDQEAPSSGGGSPTALGGSS